METNNRTKVYNVIILDKSGSMNSIAKQAVDGVNETIESIKREQELHPDQDNILTRGEPYHINLNPALITLPRAVK
ncbi:MAG: hypothetical protein IJG81_06625 [Muribaculaceae bacterium]|nr:hypothetical protein [Muribaculaceae bacterium]